MNPFPMKYSVIVMDNTGFHYTRLESIKLACYSKGVIVLCLPPYSLDFTPIEEFFGDLKKFIKRTYKK